MAPPRSCQVCLFLCLILSSSAQRLSQGASDWYMRFHEFEMVKRSFEAPNIRLFHVDTTIRHRYTVTEVRTLVHNPSTVKQTFNFGFAMPTTAFVSNVTLNDVGADNDGQRIVSVVKANEWVEGLLLQQQQQQPGLNNSQPNGSSPNGGGGANGGSSSNGNNGNNGLLFKEKLDDNTDFKQFVLPIHLKANQTAELVFSFEYLLARRHGKYSHSVSISPGQLVKDFQIGLTIEEDFFDLVRVNVTAPVLGDITADVVDVVEGSGRAKTVRFNMSLVEQSHYFGRHGFTGDFKAEFDLGRVRTAEDEDQHHDDNHTDLFEDVAVVTLPPVDVVVQDGYFLHFYDIPHQMSSIPKHVVFLLDTSVTMSGPKMDHAREAVRLLLEQLGENDYVNTILFNETSTVWRPTTSSVLRNDTDEKRVDGNNNNITEADTVFAASDALKAELVSSLMTLNTSTGLSDLPRAVDKALSLDRSVWKAGIMPENAYTLFIILTDGHSHRQHQDMQAVRRQVRQANKISRIPLFLLGMGFDANMNFLEKLSLKTGGGAINVIEDLEVEPQLSQVRRNLDDVVLKNLQLNYIGEAFHSASITETKFKAFRKGGSLAVAGKLLPSSSTSAGYAEFEVEVTGQSKDGLYLETLPTIAMTGEEYGVDCRVTLCSSLSLGGPCVTLDMSRSSLKKYGFSNQAASLNVSGDCAWEAFADAYYQGRSITLMPGIYEAIPDLHRDISSIRKRPTVLQKPSPQQAMAAETRQDRYNLLERIWAFVSIRDSLHKMDFRPESVSKSRIAEITRLAIEHNFLTPFTDLYLEDSNEHDRHDGDQEVEPDGRLVENSVVAFNDLDPVFFSMDDPDILRQWESLQNCRPPVKCESNFHYEEMPDIVTESDSYDEEDGRSSTSFNNCTGTISFFTRPNMEGDTLRVGVSVHQLYHSVNSQRMMSIATAGDCCWLLFDLRFFAGDVEKVCGDYEQRLRMSNIGSVKRIGPQNSVAVSGAASGVVVTSGAANAAATSINDPTLTTDA